MSDKEKLYVLPEDRRASGFAKFYKGMGALQLMYMPPKYIKIDTKDGFEKYVLKREGAILLEAAPSEGRGKDRSWSWDKKVKFAVNFADIPNLLMTLDDSDPNNQVKRLRGPADGSIRSYHKDQTTGLGKTLEIKKGNRPYTWFVCISEQTKGGWNNVTVELDDGEHRMLLNLITGLQNKLVGFA